MMITGRKYKNCLPKNANGWPHRCRDIYARSITCLPMKESPWTLQEHDGCYLDTVPTIPNQSTACWPLSSHQHCFSYLLGKWCFLVPKNSFTEYFSRFLFSSTLSLYALNLRPKSPQKTLLLVQFFLLSWKEEKYVGEKFFLTYDRIMITTGICPKTFAPIYPHYKSFDSYIKPQLEPTQTRKHKSCTSFDSYIKPQQYPHRGFRRSRCISFDSYIKPQP